MTDDPKLRRVLITGGTGSVGRALVEGFSRRGYKTTFQYRDNLAIADELVKSLGAEAIQMDFVRNSELPRKDFDIVVNNAGLNITDAPTHEVTLDDWNHTLWVNLTVPFKIARQCLPSMMRNRWGRIINISSIYGLRGAEGNLPYTVSKHGLSGLTKTIAKEYGQFGITCNEICPGPIESDMMNRIAGREATSSGISVESYFNELLKWIPLGKMADPNGIASLVVYLASSDADYLTGVSIPFDGGMII